MLFYVLFSLLACEVVGTKKKICEEGDNPVFQALLQQQNFMPDLHLLHACFRLQRWDRERLFSKMLYQSKNISNWGYMCLKGVLRWIANCCGLFKRLELTELTIYVTTVVTRSEPIVLKNVNSLDFFENLGSDKI